MYDRDAVAAIHVAMAKLDADELLDVIEQHATERQRVINARIAGLSMDGKPGWLEREASEGEWGRWQDYLDMVESTKPQKCGACAENERERFEYERERIGFLAR